MITVTRLNDDPIVVNADLIEFIENIPDTMITLTTGKKIIVKETTDYVINSIIEYRRSIIE